MFQVLQNLVHALAVLLVAQRAKSSGGLGPVEGFTREASRPQGTLGGHAQRVDLETTWVSSRDRASVPQPANQCVPLLAEPQR
jgi:hypothetical protein